MLKCLAVIRQESLLQTSPKFSGSLRFLEWCVVHNRVSLARQASILLTSYLEYYSTRTVMKNMPEPPGSALYILLELGGVLDDSKPEAELEKVKPTSPSSFVM